MLLTTESHCFVSDLMQMKLHNYKRPVHLCEWQRKERNQINWVFVCLCVERECMLRCRSSRKANAHCSFLHSTHCSLAIARCSLLIALIVFTVHNSTSALFQRMSMNVRRYNRVKILRAKRMRRDDMAREKKFGVRCGVRFVERECKRVNLFCLFSNMIEVVCCARSKEVIYLAMLIYRWICFEKHIVSCRAAFIAQVNEQKQE